MVNKALFSIIFILIFSFRSISTPIDKGLIIYAAIIKQNPTKDFTGLNLRQPDSVFFSVYFDKIFSINYYTLASRQYPRDFEFTELDQYSLNFVDSNYSVTKNSLCNSKYKIPFPKKGLHTLGEKIVFSGIKCTRYFIVDSFNDTTFYFVTKEFCKSAGIKILSDDPDCIIGIENKSIKIFPAYVDPSYEYDVTPLKKVPKLVPLIKSSSEKWIESPIGEIEETKPFPRFIARDIHKEQCTQKMLINSGNACTIVLVLDFIKFCKDYGPSLTGHYANRDAQSRELLDALNKLAFENKKTYLVITQDYWEDIRYESYSNLRIIPNAAEWMEKLMIFSYPLIAIVDNKGIVKDFVSIFDLDPTMNFFDGLKKLVSQND